MSLPTYEEATGKTAAWPVIAPRIPITLLTTLCLVSNEFQKIFTPLLWLEPTRLLLNRPNPHNRFEQFCKNAPRVRLEVRRNVTILDFRILQAIRPGQEDSDGLQLRSLDLDGDRYYRWFCIIENVFPSVKFILADGLGKSSINVLLLSHPRDEVSLVTTSHLNDAQQAASLLQQSTSFVPVEISNYHQTQSTVPKPTHLQPVLLSAAKCHPLSRFIVGMASQCPSLLYLDISWTADGQMYLPYIEKLSNLKILKLQGLRMKAGQVSTFLYKIGTRLFSLDLRDNQLTDEIISVLLANNILTPLSERSDLGPETSQSRRLSANSTSSSNQVRNPERYMEEPPVYRERANSLEEQETVVGDGRVGMRADTADGVVSHLLGDEQINLIRSQHGLPPASDDMMLKTGLTHLYLANNNLTSDAAIKLFSGTNRLQVVDFGSLVQAKHRRVSLNPNIRPMCQPDTVKLLEPVVSQRLEVLRIHHSIVTHTPTLGTVGEFHLSESRYVQMSEREYANQEMVHWPKAFLPDVNPRICSLTLTHVPRKSYGLVIERMINFLREASVQENLIEEATPADARRGARMLSGIRLLRLEFDFHYSRPGRDRLVKGPSVSENADADVFMEESVKDFSFFDDYIESPGCTTKDFSFFDDERPAPRVASTSSVAKQSKENESRLLRDVDQELRAYREQTRAAYEVEQEKFEAEREQVGGAAVHVPLGAPHFHWTGRLELIT